jgi:hypothetical protein
MPPSPSFPLPLAAYPAATGSLLDLLRSRIEADPFNAVATGIFFLAVLHTFAATWFTQAAQRLRHRKTLAATLHLLGEVEVVFAIWVVPLVSAITVSRGWGTAAGYLAGGVTYTEAMFVVVIMTPPGGSASSLLGRCSGRSSPSRPR